MGIGRTQNKNTYGAKKPRGSQKHVHSILEAFVNTIVSFGLSMLIQLKFFPILFGIVITPSQAVPIAFIFMGISVTRAYVIRRLFNKFIS